MTITVNTGFGYYVEKPTGRITCKVCLPAGEHELSDDYDYVEVASQADLNLVEVCLDADTNKTAADQVAIQAAIEKLAIAQAKADGYVFKSATYKEK